MVSLIESIRRRRARRKAEKITVTELPPVKQPSITVIDVGTAEQERVGAITIVGEAEGRRIGGGGVTGVVTKIEGITQKQAETILAQREQTIQEQVQRRALTVQEQFSTPETFGREYQRATGFRSFTIAVPIERRGEDIFVQDFNFLFEDGKLISQKRTGEAVFTFEHFQEMERRRRAKFPGFETDIGKIFGTGQAVIDSKITTFFPTRKEDIMLPERQPPVSLLTTFFPQRIEEDPGVIFLKPSEVEFAPGLAAQTGARIEVPEGILVTPEIGERGIEEAIAEAEEDMRVEERGGGRPPPLVVDIPPSAVEQALAIGTGVPKPPEKLDVELIKQAGREFFFIGGTPVKAIGTLASPFQRFFEKRAGEQEFFVPQFGTISTDFPGGFQVTTRFEQLRGEALIDPTLLVPEEAQAFRAGERIEEALVGELQPQVTAGTLTIEQAQKEFETQFQERAIESQKEFEIQLEKTTLFKKEIERAERPVFDVPKTAELGAVLAGGVSPIGLQLIGGAFVAEGLPRITGGETLLERGIGVGEVGLGLVGGGIAIKQAERLIDRAFLKELQSETAVVTGREIAAVREGQLFVEAPELRGVVGTDIAGVEEAALFRIKTLRRIGETGRIETELVSPVFRVGEEELAITGGRGRTALEFFSIEKGRPIKLVEEFQFGGRQFIGKEVPKIVSKGLTIELEEFTGAFGEGFIKRRGVETFKKFRFGGISRDVESELGKITEFQAGRLKGFEFEKLVPLRREGLLFERVRGRFMVEERGIIERLPGISGVDVRFIEPAKVIKTPFATTFQELKLQFPPPIGVATQIERQIFRPSQIIGLQPEVSGLVGIPRAVGGEGLTEQQLQQEREGLVFSGFQQAQFVSPIVRETQFGLVTAGLGLQELQKEIGRVAITPFEVALTGLSEAQAQRQLQRQLQAPRGELAPAISPPRFKTPFVPLGGFGFGFPFKPPKRLRFREEEKPLKGRRRPPKVRIAPSFTGIVFEIQEAAFIDPILGVLPGEIRGLETGFEIPKKKKKVKKKKSKKKK